MDRVELYWQAHTLAKKFKPPLVQLHGIQNTTNNV